MGGILSGKIRVFVLFALVAFMAFTPGIQPVKGATQALAPIKIMPFGDSITTSTAGYSSFRCPLDHLLRAAKINFIFVGSQTKNYFNVDPSWCGQPLQDFL